MKTTVKKICLSLVLLLSPAICMADEILNLNLGNDYLISSDKSINANSVEHPEILSTKPFFTIFNEKDTLLVHPQKVGKTKLTVFLNTAEVTFDICVRPKNTPATFNSFVKGGVEVTLLDQPPSFETFELDEPQITPGVNP